MPISLQQAQAAMNALRGLSGSGLFDAMAASGGYLFRKHVSKADALAYAKQDAEVKGYFKKLVTKQVDKLADYKLLTPHQKRHVTGLSTADPKPKDFGKGKSVSSTSTAPMNSTDFGNLLQAAVRSQPGGFYQAGVEVETRFLYIVGIPPGYVGRSIDQHENKSKAFNNMVLIVVAPAGGSPFLLNMFPAEAGYVNGKKALV